MSDKRVVVIVDGAEMEVSGPVADWLRSLHEANAKKRAEMLRRLEEAFSISARQPDRRGRSLLSRSSMLLPGRTQPNCRACSARGRASESERETLELSSIEYRRLT
ncbi:MAG: hypothetical protein ACK5LO_02690 [Leucobacter sp.]